MRYVLGVAVTLLFTRAGMAAKKIDFSVLKMCFTQKDCLPWQTCASCGYANFDAVVGYCSDLTARGICSYADTQIACVCGEEPSDFHQILTSRGDCITDAGCATTTEGNRCTTCVNKDEPDVKIIANFCTLPTHHPESLCHPSHTDRCSCGQLYPESAAGQGGGKGKSLYKSNALPAPNPLHFPNVQLDAQIQTETADWQQAWTV